MCLDLYVPRYMCLDSHHGLFAFKVRLQSLGKETLIIAALSFSMAQSRFLFCETFHRIRQREPEPRVLYVRMRFR